MKKTALHASLASMRLPFLLLPPICVGLGAAVASLRGFGLDMLHLVLVLVGAMAAHVSVNALNEYDDFRSGLDYNTRRTPFSGGSGFLPQAPDKKHVALITGLVACVITAAIGLFFVHIQGTALLPLGLLGLFIVMAYTRWLTRAPISCLIAPGMGFGPLMVLGTEFALTGLYSFAGMLASMVPFFLVSDLLLLNQFPDVEPDRQVGRRHLPIVIGRRASAGVYALFLLGSYVPVVVGYYLGIFPASVLLALLTLVLATPTAIGVIRHADCVQALLPFMGRNVLIVLLTPALLALGLFLNTASEAERRPGYHPRHVGARRAGMSEIRPLPSTAAPSADPVPAGGRSPDNRVR